MAVGYCVFQVLDRAPVTGAHLHARRAKAAETTERGRMISRWER
jgi:hypothetical protein